MTREKKEYKIASLFEIFLLLMGTVAFVYLVSETNGLFDNSINARQRESKFIVFLRAKMLGWMSHGLVSAQTAMWTCVENLQGTFCQEYPSDTCNSQCAAPCLQTSRENTAQCQLGTCFEPVIGTCNAGAPKFACENSGAQWSATQPAACTRNCCLIGPDGLGGADETRYTTEQECNYLSQTLGTGTLGSAGANVDWVPVSNEIECLLKANSQAEGACILELIPAEGKYNCEFTTQGNCLASGGDFYQGKLCTNSDLNAVCEKTQETSCFEEKDEVYFVDSCGNKANIYDSLKVNDQSYWNEVVPKANSCSLSTAGNPFGRQEQCGNCNYLGGSICGTPVQGRDETAVYGDYVCRDLTCVDEWGDERENLESWCSYDSKIGVDGADRSSEERSVDVPGSRYYKRTCADGEVRTEACDDARNSVCAESIDSGTGTSSAVCRVNLWEQCMAVNTEEDQEAVSNECEQNQDCFLKRVDVDDYFKFDMCAPKYAPASTSYCEIASQDCTYIEQKDIDGDWECIANCDCKKAEFSEKMNNLCMSLGDCGGQINLEGTYSDGGYSITGRTRRVSQNYINGLQQYKNPLEGQRVEPFNLTTLEALLPITAAPLPGTGATETIATILAGAGLGAVGVFAIIADTAAGGFAGITALFGTTNAGGTLIASGTGASGAYSIPVLSGFSTVAASAAAGAVVGFLIGKIFGLEGDALLITTLAGALGSTLAATGVFGNIGSFLGILGVGAAFALVVALFVFLLGIGETREKHVSFECKPWQPPTGGADCDACNGDPARPCSRYKCESLGQNCGFINEGTGSEQCIDVNPNDSTKPSINVDPNAIGDGFAYQNPQTNIGTMIKNITGDGCLAEYTPVQFGLLLNEPGQCKFDEVHTSDYGEMAGFFGDNLYLNNHTDVIAMPILDELGVSGVDPGRRGQYNLYIRCQDTSGNGHDSAEYTVNFCVRPAQDLTAPLITNFTPPSPAYAALSSENFSLQFYTNEPATCKWSLVDGDYSLMPNNALCQNEISQVTLQGWRCNTALPVQTSNVTSYYFRCADQPWLGTNVSNRNVNGQSFTYALRKTNTPLEIYDIKPNEQTISSASIPATAILEAKTRGGANNNALCEYSFTGNAFTPFFQTGGTLHRNTFNQLLEGQYNVELMCTDAAGNVATETSEFSVQIDNQGPLITRVYDGSGTLNVITNEPAMCRFSTTNCGFTFANGTAMSGSNYLHTTSFSTGTSYRIKCQDNFGNIGQCLSVTGGY